MAIVSSIAVGKARKSAGNVTFTTLKGRTIMKEKPLSVKNPDTDKQRNNRKALSLAVYYWQILGKYAKDGITRTTAYGSKYNRFVQNVLPFAKSTGASADNAGDVVPQGFKLTEGEMPSIVVGFAVSGGVQSVSAPSSSLIDAGVKVGDILVGIAFDYIGQKTYKATKVLTAGDLAGVGVGLPITGAVEDADHSYCMACYVVSADGRRSSTSTLVEF